MVEFLAHLRADVGVEGVREILYDIAEAADKAGDDGTNDLVVSDVLRANELQSWFIGNHLVEMPLTVAR